MENMYQDIAQMKKIQLNLDNSGVITIYDNGNDAITIESENLKGTCPYCNNSECYGNCDGSAGDIDNLETEEDMYDRKMFNSVIDGLESLVMAHYNCGIDVISRKYINGINIMLEGTINHYLN